MKNNFVIVHFPSQAKHDLNIKLKDAASEMEMMNEQLEEEQAARAQLQQKLSKALTEGGPKKGLDDEDVAKIEELEDAKRKLATRVQELEEALTAAESKSAGMEKIKSRMNDEVEDLLLDLEKVQSLTYYDVILLDSSRNAMTTSKAFSSTN